MLQKKAQESENPAKTKAKHLKEIGTWKAVNYCKCSSQERWKIKCCLQLFFGLLYKMCCACDI